MLSKLLIFGIAIGAAAQISAPRAGYIVDAVGSLRPVSGLAGAFVVGSPIDSGVISAAFSGKALVVKKQNELLVDGKVFEAPAGPVEVAFGAKGQLKEVFFSESSLLWVWQGNRFEERSSNRPGWATVTIHEDEVSIAGTPVRLPSRVLRTAQLGENWIAVYTESGVFAVRNTEIYELPEGDE